MNNLSTYLTIFFLIINLIAFTIMWIDKTKSKKPDSNRISEGLLFFMAVFFGSIGVYIGMFTFRHKTKKWYFILGIPLVILENITFLWAVYQILN